jgi:two-component system response regulator HydG
MAGADPPEELDDVSTLTHPPDPQHSGAAFDLEVIEGPDLGMRLALDFMSTARVLVGQSPSCDARLTDRAVSRRHASLELEERGLRLTDLDSSNGTFVNGMRVVQMFVQGGEIVRIGGTTLRVHSRPAGPRPESPDATHFGRLVGASLEMRRLYPLCERLAQSTVPVIIEGETGTGKEVLAEALHECGPRAAGPFVVFDCTAVAPSLVESELFGHERGAFTGATSARKGLFEQAHGGTLLIDEIGELASSLQPKLLGAIERSQIRRVGGDRPISVDVRILAATRRDLDHEVQVGHFRDDLFHRLAVARIELPPLRRRRGDVRGLVQHFCRELEADPETIGKRIGPLLHRWEEDPWPGNVRELRNAVVRQLALGDAADLDDPALDQVEQQTAGSVDEAAPDDAIARVLKPRLPFGRARARVLEEFRQRYLEQVLAEHGGNVVRAAAASGVGRRYFQRIRAKQRER